ncbi:MAG: gfo/Idh/MocA family oxidoreductase, partial [Planctomycetes bacterium]|nr:gfo/Idh/MocA family oxidoreductase [Planctomycetota bacterium]
MRTCLIEVGHWHAPMYAGPLKASPHELAAVSDRDGARAAAFAEKHGARAYTDYREMLAKERPDFVMALGRHCEMTRIADDLV